MFQVPVCGFNHKTILGCKKKKKTFGLHITYQEKLKKNTYGVFPVSFNECIYTNCSINIDQLVF